MLRAGAPARSADAAAPFRAAAAAPDPRGPRADGARRRVWCGCPRHPSPRRSGSGCGDRAARGTKSSRAPYTASRRGRRRDGLRARASPQGLCSRPRRRAPASRPRPRHRWACAPCGARCGGAPCRAPRERAALRRAAHSRRSGRSRRSAWVSHPFAGSDRLVVPDCRWPWLPRRRPLRGSRGRLPAQSGRPPVSSKRGGSVS